MIVYDENIVSVAYDDSSWVVDSGANFHVTLRREFFSSYTLGDFWCVEDG